MRPSDTRLAVLALAAFTLAAPAAEPDPVKSAQELRKGGRTVPALSEAMVVAEAEEFQVASPGWKGQPWGTNYFCATFANSFLSRKAYLGAPEQCESSSASISVQVPKAGRYLALVRYESVYRFETQFRLKVSQGGKDKLDRLYGARDNLKVWAFGQKLQKELAWDWGADENVVWEGHDAFVDLDAGPATLTLTAGKQPTPAARRNVDLVMLTSDVKDVEARIQKEGYLPLDGLLTQSGDLFLKLHNKSDGPLTLTVPNGTEHSPYWVHMRTWKPKTVTAAAGQSSDWVEVGSVLDSLNDGQWNLTVKESGRYDLEFGVPGADGKVESIRKLEGLTGNQELAYEADTRYTRRIRPAEDVLYDLVDYLKKQPVEGTPPKQTLLYGTTFSQKPGNQKYNAAIDEFVKLVGATALIRNTDHSVEKDGGLVRGYIDVRDVPTPKLEDHCKKLKADGLADRIAVVSLGDEIGLAAPPAGDNAGFRAWLQSQKLKPADVDPDAGESWDRVNYNPDPKLAQSKPSLFYWSKIYSYRYGIRQLKERTEILKRYLPNAGFGANFSPHHKHLYLGDTHQWISLFREGGMTMPWGEDYVWQVPVGTQQMNFLMLDMFRCGVRNNPEAKIQYYVMPHTPGNTTASWRRQFYGDLAHGAKVLNLFEFRPVQAAYTENHCSDPAMFQAVRQAFHELGRFEDVIQDGHVRPGIAGLWFSEAADVWDDNRSPNDAGKRSLYIAARHQQLPLDCVTEGDELKGYKVLYLTDAHVSRKASEAIRDWVQDGGGRLIATAGAGQFDEYNAPNRVLRELLGVDAEAVTIAGPQGIVRREKEDLPFAQPLGTVTLTQGGKLPAVAALGHFFVTKAEVLGTFDGGKPAVTRRKSGKGEAWYCGFLPGLSYFKAAIPLRPVDRGATDDTMAHFIPTEFDAATKALLGEMTEGVSRPVVCSEPLVETTVIEAKSGVVIPLVNWSKGPIKGLTVTVSIDVPLAKVELASGKPVKATGDKGQRVFTLDLDVADALILR